MSFEKEFFAGNEVVISQKYRKYLVGYITKVNKRYVYVTVPASQYDNDRETDVEIVFLKSSLKEKGTSEYSRIYRYIVQNWQTYSLATKEDAEKWNADFFAEKEKKNLVNALRDYRWQNLDLDTLRKINDLLGGNNA